MTARRHREHSIHSFSKLLSVLIYHAHSPFLAGTDRLLPSLDVLGQGCVIAALGLHSRAQRLTANHGHSEHTQTNDMKFAAITNPIRL